jgi:hypothetical protein
VFTESLASKDKEIDCSVMFSTFLLAHARMFSHDSESHVVHYHSTLFDDFERLQTASLTVRTQTFGALTQIQTLFLCDANLVENYTSRISSVAYIRCRRNVRTE